MPSSQARAHRSPGGPTPDRRSNSMEEIAGGSLVSLPGRGISSRVASERPVPVDALNLETPRTALGPTVTPAGSFFVRSHFPVPELRVGAWKLAISGEVDRPRAWSLADLHDLPRKRVVATLECAGNGRKGFRRPAPGELRWGDHAVGTAVWEGVPLSVLLNEAGLRCEAHHLVFSGADYGDPGSRACRFSRSLSLDLTGGRDDVLVATEMNGRSLPPEHGAPARLVVPGWYGMAWVKWLSTIVARRTPFRGYFQAARYVYRSRQGGRVVVEPVRRIRVKSLIIDPGGAEPLVRGRRYPIS